MRSPVGALWRYYRPLNSCKPVCTKRPFFLPRMALSLVAARLGKVGRTAAGRARTQFAHSRCRGTAGAQISGTGRLQEDTEGHGGAAVRVQADLCGAGGTLEDTPSTRFGTVRPRVQIPGPRPIN